ncbi:hypothetical protein BVRB_5g101510 [Beta vulgaris subsp. vulgaris]|uniref:transcription factor bHLH126 isoform X1 n=1 Tax=Beta vulgaris subsp. vulgaris TaxID=3555 RepID=UPI00054002EA|nr:transcription factor bHLH126 isoform X1 [Beta vulgaris subsp. vulgaris]KMT12203.1 hypothetical protein BVRB_5g101510 [Beta vulgaris subsp. vulgaris]
MMNNLSPPIFDPFCSQNDELFYNIPDFVPATQILADQGDQIIPTQEQQQNDEFINQFPTFIEDPSLETNNNHIVQLKKRSLSSTLRATIDYDHKNVDIIPNDKKKKQKIIHREVERQRRLEMSSLHISLRSLLPLEYIKGKPSISAHLEEAVKYIKQMQQKIKGLNDQRDGLRKEVSNIEKHAHDHNNVIINVFKESLEVIVSTKCEDVEGDEGLPLSKVLQCLIQEGLDVVSAISKKVNTNYVHCIHAQVIDEGNIAIDVTNLKKKIADIQI